MKHLVFPIVAVLPLTVAADGLPMKNGRHPGKVITFALAAGQRAMAERSPRGHPP